MSDLAVQRWLERLVSERGDVASAMLVLGAGEQVQMSTHWPPQSPHDADLLDAARTALARGPRAVIIPAGQQIVAGALKQEGRRVGAVAMRLAAERAPQRGGPDLTRSDWGPFDPLAGPAATAESSAAGAVLAPVDRSAATATVTVLDDAVKSGLAHALSRGTAIRSPPCETTPAVPEPAPPVTSRVAPDRQPEIAPGAVPATDTAAPPAAPSAADAVPAPAAPDEQAELLALIADALHAEAFDPACAGLATRLAGAFDAERAFVGMVARRFVRVHALSHGATPKGAPALLGAVGAAMDEALDQAASVRHPQHPDEAPRITMAHAALAERHGVGALLTVPLYAGARPVGALVLEARSGRHFDDAALARAERIASALAPLLLLKLDHERSGFERWRARRAARVAALGMRQRVLRSGLATLAGAALLALGALPVPYKLGAPTRLEGQVQRAMVAPVDGFLKSVHVRPGDEVKAGQLLAELSDEDLRLERQRWLSEVARHENSYAEAQAKQDRTQLVLADARATEARAQLALVEQQLARTQLVAPFDALVVKGDLTQQLGAPLRRGDMLLTLAPSREFRVMLELDERDVGQVQPGMRGAVTLSALPERSFDLVVERVMPVARSEGGRNLFEAEARLAGIDGAELLRPGLQGAARLDAGEQPLAWVLSHRVVAWLRLQWWSYLG